MIGYSLLNSFYEFFSKCFVRKSFESLVKKISFFIVFVAMLGVFSDKAISQALNQSSKDTKKSTDFIEKKGYKTKDKTLLVTDLADKYRQQLSDIERQAHNSRLSVYLEHLYQTNLQQLVQDSKSKDLKTVEAELLKVSDPSEADLKKWYEEHKAQIPYEYNLIKDQLADTYKRQLQMKKKSEVINKLKKQYDFVMIDPKPQDFVMTIDLTGLSLPTKGAKDPKVIIYKFSDFYCPSCKAASFVLSDIVKKYKTVQVVYVPYPIFGQDSLELSLQALCAAKQDKFWQLHDKIFALSDKPQKGFFKKVAKDLKLDMDKIKACQKKEADELIKKIQKTADDLAVQATPTIFVGGVKMASYDKKVITDQIDKLLKKK